jgi:hypothetical protein
MSILKGLKARVRSIRDARGAESRMEEEFLFHVDMETERLVAEGLSPDEARRRALISFGGMERHAKRCVTAAADGGSTTSSPTSAMRSARRDAVPGSPLPSR